MDTLTACCWVLVFYLVNMHGAFFSEITTESETAVEGPSNEGKSVNLWNCTGDIKVEREFEILKNGSLLLSESNRLYELGTFRTENGTAYICSTNQTEKPSTKVVTPSRVQHSREFMRCLHTPISKKDFEIFENETVFIPKAKQYYEPGNYHLIQNGNVYVCAYTLRVIPNDYNTNVTLKDHSSEAVEYLSTIGLSISILCLILHLVVFCCVEKMRNLPGCCLAELCLSLLLAYVLFLFSSLTDNKEQCANLGVTIYFMFLASFFWMNVIAFDVYLSLRMTVTKMRVSIHEHVWKKLILYSVYSWVVPGLISGFAKVADISELISIDYRPAFGSNYCWFGSKKALLVFFAAPLIFIMVLNSIFFISSLCLIHKASLNDSVKDGVVLKKYFFICFKLAVITGLTWIFGIVAGFVDLKILWYLFMIFNTSQGLFIFLSFPCSKTVRTDIFTKIRRLRPQKNNSRQSLPTITTSLL